MLPDFRVRQRDYFLEIARALTEELDLDTLLGRILKTSIEILAGQAGFIALRSRKVTWNIQVSQGLPKVFIEFVEAQFKGFADATQSEENEIATINRLMNEITYAASWGLLSGVGLPMVARNNVVGIIYIFRSYAGVFSSNDRSLLSSFANQAAVAVQNAQLVNQLTQEKQRVNAMLDASADGFLILAANLQVERCNLAFSRLIGSNPKDLVGRNHDDVILWTKPPQGLSLKEAVAGGWPLTPYANLYVEGDIKHTSNPTAIPVGITYAPLNAQDGTLLNIIATVRDITRFRQADELKSTFVSIVSHELKTPVALIKGYVSTLRREDARWDRKVVQDSLQVIEEEADHLTELIENLLDATRLQAGGLKLKRSDISLPLMAERLAKRFQIQSPDNQIITSFPTDFPIILVDESRIEQVLTNLITNAIKYAPQGEIEIRGQTRAEMVIVCVSDQGPGIDPEDIPHVFDRFYRAPQAARQTKGAGLGLYLSRSIIEVHGGRMWVDPHKEDGARICFSLPR